MNPTILSKDIEQRGKGSGRLHFIIDNIDVSIINGLRRVITSNIPTLVFRGFPDKDNQINIYKTQCIHYNILIIMAKVRLLLLY